MGVRRRRLGGVVAITLLIAATAHGCRADGAASGTRVLGPVAAAPAPLERAVLGAPLPVPVGDQPDPTPEGALRPSMVRYCEAEQRAVAEIDADETQGDALEAAVHSVAVVTGVIAEALADTDAAPLHWRVAPLARAAETTHAAASAALDGGHAEREAFLREQLEHLSYLQPLVDDPHLTEIAMAEPACGGLPLGAVLAAVDADAVDADADHTRD